MKPKKSKSKLFVGGLAHVPSASEESLEEYFNKWGKVQSFQLIKDTHTQKSKGFGFVTFETSEAATNCLNHSPHTIDGKNISVKPCKEKERSHHDRTPHSFGHHYNGHRMNHHHHHHGPNAYRPSIPNYPMMHQHVPHGNHHGNHYRPMNYWVNNGQNRYSGGYNSQNVHNNQHHDIHDNQSTKSSSSQHNHTSGLGGHRGGGHGHHHHIISGGEKRVGSGGENASTPPNNRNDDELQVFVGGLPHNAGEKDLSNHFSRFGIVDHVSVAKDKQGGEGHKGFAFVTFANKEDRDKSLECADHRIKNRTVKVEKKKPSGKKEQSRPSYNSSLKNSNGSFSHPRSSNVKHDKPSNGRSHSGHDQRVVSQPEQNGIISPELNQTKVSYQQPLTPSVNPGHVVNPGQYLMHHPMTHHNYHQHPQHIYPHHQQPVMYPAQPIFHQIPQMINPGHNIMSHSQDPNQVAYHSYMMPQAVVQQPMMMQHQIQQGQVPNSQPPISQSPHPGQSGGYYINATQNPMIQMAQPTQQPAPPVLQAANSDQANQQQLHGTTGRSPTIQ